MLKFYCLECPQAVSWINNYF